MNIQFYCYVKEVLKSNAKHRILIIQHESETLNTLSLSSFFIIKNEIDDLSFREKYA